jgi:hypothetical protein
MCVLLCVAGACSREEKKVVKSHTTDKPESFAFAEPETTS